VKLFFTSLSGFFIFIFSLNAQTTLEIVYEPENGTVLFHDEFTDSSGIDAFIHKVISDLHSASYLAASVDSVIYSGDTAVAYVHKGLQYRWVRLTIDTAEKQILEKLRIRPGKFDRQTVTVDAFRQVQNRLLNHYENSGYPFASVALTHLEINGDTINGRLAIRENRFYLIDSIHISGEVTVDYRYIYRHIGIRPGDPFSERKFENAGHLIRTTPFLNEIRAPEMEFMSETADMYLYVGRKQANHFNGILGIMPGGTEQKVKFAGEVNLGLMNIFRRMETITFSWQSPGNMVQQMDMEFAQPYIFARAFGIDFQLHMFRQDSTYINIESEAGIPFIIPGGSVVRIFGKTAGTSLIAGSSHTGTVLSAAETRSRLLGLAWRNNRVDNPVNPFRGWMVKASAGAGTRSTTLPGESGLQEKTGSAIGEGIFHMQWYIPVSSSGTVKLANISAIKMNTGGKNKADHFFYNELFLLGGLHTIRGFDERSIAASAYSIQRLEYRYLFDVTSHTFVFFDGMAYKRRLPDQTSSDTPFGFGGGLSFGTRAGQFSISYALGRQLGNPVSFRSAKVHMGIINRF
jgi:outer membrane protein assembly factor BamA